MSFAALRPHFKPTLTLAYPVVLSQLGHVLVNVCDSVVVGQLGKAPLAAVSVGVSVTTVVMMLGLGLSMGITPLVAAADGQHDLPRLGRLLAAGVWLSVLAGAVLAAVGLVVAPLLPHLGQPPAVVALAAPWVRVMFLSFLPLMVFQGFKQFAEGLGLTRQAMYLSVLANVVNAALCVLLVFGRLKLPGLPPLLAGVPALGMVGSAWATLAARCLMALLMAAYVLRAARLRAHRAAVPSWLRPSGAALRQVVGLGAPIGVQMMFEVGAFGFAGLMMGWLGVTPQAAHQIAINVASVTYMAASGLAAAATIRVGNLRGLGDAAGAQQAGFAAYLLTLGFMVSMGLLLLAGRSFIAGLYTHDAVVVAQAASLLLVAAAFQVSDGVQVVGLGALRGLEDVKMPSVVALLAYWVVALPLGYILGFGLRLGSLGVWLGLLLGLTLVAGVLLWRFRRLSKLELEASSPPQLRRG